MVTRRDSLMGMAGLTGAALSGSLFAQQWPSKVLSR